MADRDPAEQQGDREDATDGKSEPTAPDSNPGLDDSIDKALDNQSQVSPDDYPEKAGDIPL